MSQAPGLAAAHFNTLTLKGLFHFLLLLSGLKLNTVCKCFLFDALELLTIKFCLRFYLAHMNYLLAVHFSVNCSMLVKC